MIKNKYLYWSFNPINSLEKDFPVKLFKIIFFALLISFLLILYGVSCSMLLFYNIVKKVFKEMYIKFNFFIIKF